MPDPAGAIERLRKQHQQAADIKPRVIALGDALRIRYDRTPEFDYAEYMRVIDESSQDDPAKTLVASLDAIAACCVEILIIDPLGDLLPLHEALGLPAPLTFVTADETLAALEVDAGKALKRIGSPLKAGTARGDTLAIFADYSGAPMPEARVNDHAAEISLHLAGVAQEVSDNLLGGP